MRRFILHLCLLVLVLGAKAQNARTLLRTIHQAANTNFKEITAPQTDTASIFYPSTLKPPVGEIKIGHYPATTTLNWTMPLAQSKEVKAAVSDFIKTTYGNTEKYKLVRDGTEEEGYITTNIYVRLTPKPLLVFQTVYYKDKQAPDNSQFNLTIYGKLK